MYFNATGIYSVKMRLKREIPNILPILGKRLKIFYTSNAQTASESTREKNAEETRLLGLTMLPGLSTKTKTYLKSTLADGLTSYSKKNLKQSRKQLTRTKNQQLTHKLDQRRKPMLPQKKSSRPREGKKLKKV